LDKLEVTMLSQHVAATTREAGKSAYVELILISISTVILVLIALSFAYTLLRGVNLSLDKAVNVANSIAQGNLNNEFNIDNQDETGQLLHVLDNMQQQLRERIEREQTMAEAALRINEALDNVTTSVLIADNDYNIIYLNKAAQRLFKEQEQGFIQEIPHFRADNLLNQSVDVLHKDPQVTPSFISAIKRQ
jgi:methyl-accepting chemotaxis protein